MINAISSATRTAYLDTYCPKTSTSENTKSTNDMAAIYEPSNVLYQTKDSAIKIKSNSDNTSKNCFMKNSISPKHTTPAYTLTGADKMWKVLTNGKIIAEEAAISQTVTDM